jgi:hypothetical protein
MRRTFNMIIAAAALQAVSFNLSPQSYAEDQLAAQAYPGELAIEALTEGHGALSGQWDISGGFDYSGGKYGASRATNVYYAPFGAGYRKGRWSVSVDSGYVKVKGPVDYASILDLTPEDVSALGLDMETVSVSGIADTVVGARYAAFEWFDSGTFIDVGMRVKLPTASKAKGLGNGKVTGDAQIDVTQLYGLWSFLISGSYGFRSHKNGGRDVQSVSVGVGRSLSRKLAVGAVFDWRTSPRPGGSKGRELVAYGSYEITQSLSVTAYAVRGFSRASVENSAGLRFRYRFP